MKYLILTLVVLSQACFGSLYAWSTFVPPLQENYALSATGGQIIFGGMILTNTIIMILAGKLLSRWGPRPLVIAGGFLFTAGYLLAGFSSGSFTLLFLGVAVFVGCGIGLGYITLLITCIQWFPDNKGLASGLAVAGFGGGAIAVATIADRMLGTGFTVLQVFKWLAISGGSIIIISGIIIKSAPESEKPTSRTGRLKLSLLIQDPRIWSLFLAMFAGTFTGLTVIGNLKPIALVAGFSGSVATYSVAVFAAGNAGGRILWGWLIDIFGKKTIPADLLLLALATTGIAASQTVVLFFSSAFLVGLCFGASFVIYATYISETYGANKTAEIYPLVFLSQGLSGIAGPASGGISYDLTGNYSWALIIAIAMTGTAGFLFLLSYSSNGSR